MGDLIANLSLGFGVVFQFVQVDVPGIGMVPMPMNIFLCFVGCLVGTLIGVCQASGRSPRSRCCCRSPSSSIRSAR
jgi:putative tricarboxylic transport membrane protein